MTSRAFFSSTRLGRALRAAFLACAAGGVALALLDAMTFQWRAQPAVQGTYIETGEGLLTAYHPSIVDVSYHLPLGSVLFALHDDHTGPLLHHLLNVACLPVLTLMVAGIGLLTGSVASALLAAALFLLFEGRSQMLLPYSDYAILVLACGAVLVWRARAPSLAKTFLLALALGTSLLFRSPLAFFPFVLIAYEGYVRPDARMRPYWPHAAVLAVVPYLLLLPWLGMNLAVHHKLILFEDGQADVNIITGALGIVPCVVGESSTLMPTPVDYTRSFPVLRWALSEIARHPVRYALSCLGRVAYVFSFNPWLFALALAGLFLTRRRPQTRALALLAAYFLGIHCFMSLKDDYMRPLWPLLVPLAALLWDRAWALPESRTDGVGFRLAAAGLAGWVLLSVGFGAYVSFVAVRYGLLYLLRSPQSQAALEQAFARGPEDAWVRRRRAEFRLRSGDVSGALLDYTHAVAEKSDDADLRLDMGWALSLRGRPDYLLRHCPYPYQDTSDDIRPMNTGMVVYIKPYLYKGLALHASGRETEAREQVRAAWTTIDSYQTLHRLETPEEKADLERIHAKDGFVLLHVLDAQFDGLPPAKRAYLLGESLKLAPRDAGLWIGQGEAALEAGDRALSLASFQRARGLPLDDQALQREWALGAKLGVDPAIRSTLRVSASG